MTILSKPTILETIVLPRNLKPDEKRRVERLGKLNDARKQALVAGDSRTLLKLAAKYEKLSKHGGCPRLANVIRGEATRFGNGKGGAK